MCFGNELRAARRRAACLVTMYVSYYRSRTFILFYLICSLINNNAPVETEQRAGLCSFISLYKLNGGFIKLTAGARFVFTVLIGF